MIPTTNKIGLALSGGGFRASLYHLGLVRFLRDAGILPRVTHITSVSGGSILAAHLVLNWDRYNGSANDFEAAASEVLAFVRLDVRNRIVRRFPLMLPFRGPRWLLGWSNRRLTRTGLLEYHYAKYLLGDRSLFQLPERPQLHILATNLSEGCLCSFHRNGLWMIRRQSGRTFRIDHIHVGLATVPMAVTASSAFPGFFPPFVLTGADVGAHGGEFGRQAYTDGGVFDNLGVRMFRFLERPLLMDNPLSRDDFLDLSEVARALREASQSSEETPLRRVAQYLVATRDRPAPLLLGDGGPAAAVLAPPSQRGNGDREDFVASNLGILLRRYLLYREPLFASLKPATPDADALFLASRQGERVLDAGDQYWLNRHLLEAAFRQATGRGCFRRLDSALDGVLVSDVGKRIEVRATQRAGGLIRTSLRATEIVMDRVWQLENETFQGMPGFVFAPIGAVVEPADDPTALHPEIQRQAASIRTDFDGFSPLEISTLVQHGYCVGRKACRARPELFGDDLPANAPWDPVPAPQGAEATLRAARLNRRSREPGAATVEARLLQDSAVRRIWSTLLDHRDWASWVYVPLLVPILILLPWVATKYYRHAHRINQIAESLSQGSQELEQMSRLLASPLTPWKGETPEEVGSIDEPDLSGFEILQDMRILDLRTWDPAAKGSSDSGSQIYSYRRLKVFKRPEHTGSNEFRFYLLATSPLAQVRFPPQQVPGKVRMAKLESSIPGQNNCRWGASFDFEKVPAGEYVDLIVEYFAPGRFLQRSQGSTTLSFEIQGDTAEVTRWILLPSGREYQNFRVVRYKTGEPDTAEEVRIVTEYLAHDFTILAYKLLAVPAGYTYEVTWNYN
jgi:predicted acylesterase/phospholipase RssA